MSTTLLNELIEQTKKLELVEQSACALRERIDEILEKLRTSKATKRPVGRPRKAKKRKGWSWYKRQKLAASVKKLWDVMTPEQRRERITKMKQGRGLDVK